ncbi:MAG TPA: polysaccharide deacetylase family protein [Firmicutes bacterium]|nr:polysaccharide deacetylase family protein [Bacillota bacterium]
MRVLIVSRKQFFAVSAFCIMFLSGLLFGIHAAAEFASAGDSRILPIYRVACTDDEDRRIALTFDVAWTNSDLSEITEILDKYQAKATFFCTGSWLDDYPEDAKSLFNAGHDVQNHSDRHPHVAEMDTASLLADTDACSQKIKALTGMQPDLYRAPYGEYDNEMMAALEGAGMQVIQWDVDSRDWQEETTVSRIVSNVRKHTRPGSILLFHVDAKPGCTPEALDQILQDFSKDGYSFVLVRDLIYPADASRIDSQGEQHPISPNA